MNPSAFLNLFVTQLQYQDPTAPMDPSQMTTVLAQLTTVQDLSNLQTSFQQSLADGMIGDQVTYTSTANGASQTGTVTASQVQNGAVGVLISGQFVPLSAITQIAPTATNGAQVRARRAPRKGQPRRTARKDRKDILFPPAAGLF